MEVWKSEVRMSRVGKCKYGKTGYRGRNYRLLLEMRLK